MSNNAIPFIAACTAWLSLACGADDFGLSHLDRQVWMRTGIAQSVPPRLFWLVPIAARISGLETTKETWERKGYEESFPTLVDEARIIVERVASLYLQKEWQPTKTEIGTGMHLIPARLQPHWHFGEGDKASQPVVCREFLLGGRYAEPEEHYSGRPDRLYCSYASSSRKVLLMVTNGPDCGVGICITLSKDERALLDVEDLNNVQALVDELLHAVLISDPCAPYSIKLQRDGESGPITIRGRHDIPGFQDVPDTDASPAHWMSAMAGMIADGKLVVVLPGEQFYFDPEKRERVCRIPPATFSPVYSDHYFDGMIGKEFHHELKKSRKADGQ